MSSENAYSDYNASSGTSTTHSYQQRSFDPYRNNYNGFSEVTDPLEYMDAPSTLLNDGSSMAYEYAGEGNYFDISPLLSTNDPVTMHFMAQCAIADAKGAKVLSYHEIEDLKKEQTLLHSRLKDTEHKLGMEMKVKEAAASLSKLHSQRNSTSDSNMARRSFLKFGNESKDRKRVSRHAEEEIETANRRIASLQQEYFKLSERYTEISNKILCHNSAILALSYARVAGQGDDPTVMMKTGSKEFGMFKSAQDEDKLDRLISTLKQSDAPNDEFVWTDYDQRSKVDEVDSLCQGLLSHISSLREENALLKSNIHHAIKEVDPECQVTGGDLCEQLMNRLSNLKQEHNKLKEESVQAKSMDGVSNGESADQQPIRLMKKHLESLTLSYESNRRELEKLELENVDLRTNLRDTMFSTQAKTQELENELKTNLERVGEWRERCENLQTELESVVKSLEDITRQAVDYESEKAKMENQVIRLEKELQAQTKSALDKRLSMIGSPGKDEVNGKTPSEQNKDATSVAYLRHEFRKIMMDMNTKHNKQLKYEQSQRKKVESLLRSIKHSSYAVNIPPAKLEALDMELNA